MTSGAENGLEVKTISFKRSAPQNAARLERLIPEVLGGAVAGVALGRFMRCRTRIMIGMYALLWLSVYSVYYVQMR